MGTRAAKQSIRSGVRGAESLLSKTGKKLRKEGAISGFQVNAEHNWVTAVYKVSERPRAVEIRISPKLENGTLGVLVATLVDNDGDFVAGITGPTKIDSGFSPDDLKAELVDSLLRHSIADLPVAADMKAGRKSLWNGMFLAALDAREKAEVVYEMVRRERNRGNTIRARALNRHQVSPAAVAS